MATSPKKQVVVNRPPVLFDQTQRIVTQIEKRIDGAFLSYWQSWNGSVCQADVVGFYELLKKIGKQKKAYLFIKSDGGTGTASLRIVHLLRQYVSNLVILVPMQCASAGTMIALGADEIQMGPLAYLSAVDTSLTHVLSPVDNANRKVSVSLDELSRILAVWNREAKSAGDNPYSAIFPHIHPLVIGAVDRASSLSIRLCSEILSYHMKDPAAAEKISQALNANYPSHSYPITIKEAQRLGLNVKPLDSTLNELLLELNEVYSEMGQHALTDYDEANYHDNEILNIVEARGVQVFYQTDKDWHYRSEEKRWIPMNDKSSWRRIVPGKKGQYQESVFYIR